MSFTSLVFLVFLPVVMVLHYVARRWTGQNAVLLVSSYVFYGNILGELAIGTEQAVKFPKRLRHRNRGKVLAVVYGK